MKLDSSALLAHGTDIPGARASAAGRGADTLAWRREMERAQAQTWFKGALPHSTDKAGAGRRDTDMASTVDAPRARSSSPATMPAVVLSARDQLWLSPSAVHEHRFAPIVSPRNQPSDDVVAGAGRDVPRAPGASAAEALRATSDLHGSMSMTVPAGALPPPSAGALLPSVRTEGEVPSESADAPQRSFTRIVQLESLPPVRLHVEATGAEATIWLGVDAGAEPQLPDIVRSLARWLGGAGYRAVNWVCNGREISAPVLLDDSSALPSVDAADEPWSFDTDTPPTNSLTRREFP